MTILSGKPLLSTGSIFQKTVILTSSKEGHPNENNFFLDF